MTMNYIWFFPFTYAVYFVGYILWAYYKGSQKHRKEFSAIYWYFGNRFGSTPFSAPRALYLVIDKFLKYDAIGFRFGLTFAAARVMIKNGDRFLLCTLSEERRAKEGRSTDIGPGGMIEVGSTPQETAIEELDEEINVDVDDADLTIWKIITPAHGLFCLVFIFELAESEIGEFSLANSDGTFASIEWATIDEIRSTNLRRDAERIVTFM